MTYRLFYDKYAGDHRFDNVVTREIDVDDLLNGDYDRLMVGPVAIDEYHHLFHGFKPVPKELSDEYTAELYLRMTGDEVTESYLMFIIDGLDRLEDDRLSPALARLAVAHYRYLRRLSTGSKQERIIKNIDRVIERVLEATEYNDHHEIDQPKEILGTLFRYQKCSIDWMIKTEQKKKGFRYSCNDELVLDDSLMIDLVRHQLIRLDERQQVRFSGGAIIDEVGLGKTLQVTTLAMLNPATDFNYFGRERWRSRATLVICPTQLCGQWERELRAMISSSAEPTIIRMISKPQHEKYTLQELLDADFVIVSFTFIDNASLTSRWAPSATYQRSLDFSVADAEKLLENKMRDRLKNPFPFLLNAKAILPLIEFHRLVIDEFHEVYSNPKYQYLKNTLPLYRSTYRWAVTATPFTDSENLYHVFNYLTDFRCSDGRLALLDENILSHLAENTFRRNTKKSVKDEHTLPPIEEEVIWLKFTPTERMMYQAYLANPNNDPHSAYLQKLCCHPKLADETKLLLANCHSLEQIEEKMVGFYRTRVVEAQGRVAQVNNRIYELQQRIRVIEIRQRYRLDGDPLDSEEEVDPTEEYVPIPPNQKLAIVREIEQRIVEQQAELADREKLLAGEETTCNFFENVISRIRKTAEKPKGVFDPMMMLQQELDDEEDEDDEEETCAICLGEIEPDEIGVTKCGHIYCYSCLKTTIGAHGKCPKCMRPLKADEITMIDYELPTKVETDSLVDEVGTKLAQLIRYLKEHDRHTIIFSQWDDLLLKVGKVLRDHSIKNIFCRGNAFQRDRAIRDFNEDDKVKVIMLSSEKAASGTNLTKATQVVLLEPIYGDYSYRKGVETQAIGRAHRLGQTKKLKLVRFLIRGSVEEDIYRQNLAQDQKVVEEDPYQRERTEIEKA